MSLSVKRGLPPGQSRGITLLHLRVHPPHGSVQTGLGNVVST